MLVRIGGILKTIFPLNFEEDHKAKTKHPLSQESSPLFQHSSTLEIILEGYT